MLLPLCLYIIGRRLRNLYIFVTASPTYSTNSDLCGHYRGPGSRGEVVKVECCPGLRGRFVRLQPDYRFQWDYGTDNYLSLCEVEVY